MLIFKIIIPFLLALAVVAAADYLYHPTIEIHSHLSESDIHKLKGELQEKGITLEIADLKFNATGEIKEIKGFIDYYGLTSGQFHYASFGGVAIKGGLLQMDSSAMNP